LLPAPVSALEPGERAEEAALGACLVLLAPETPTEIGAVAAVVCVALLRACWCGQEGDQQERKRHHPGSSSGRVASCHLLAFLFVVDCVLAI